MILDAIIGLFVSIVGFILVPVAEFLSLAFTTLLNLIVAAIEAIIRIFVTGFRIGRFKKWDYKRGGEDGKPETPDHPMAIWWSTATALLIFAAIFLGPKIINRKVALVTKDGHSLPFASLIIHTKSGDDHKRTDNAGNITVSRFSTTGITLKDPRYVQQTWKRNELEPQLVARRTILGSSLDFMADRLLKSVE